MPGDCYGYDGPAITVGQAAGVRPGTIAARMIEPVGPGPMWLLGLGPEIPDGCQPENVGISELMVLTSTAPRAGEEPWQ
jgi:hypothetical protein